MRLTDLNPRYGETDGVRTHISFECPPHKIHRIFVPIAGPKKWESSGDTFETLTLSPSIRFEEPPVCDCHFFIQNGEIIICA